MIKIQYGNLKGRTIRSPISARPTMSWARSVFFNWMRHDLSGMLLLDACAGSGIIAFESLSLGAEKVVCLDNDATILSSIQSQAKTLKLNLKILKHDWPKQLICEESFDIVFWDPPYDASWRWQVFSLIDSCTQSGSLLCIESRCEDYAHDVWEQLKSSCRGSTQLQLLRKL